MRHVSRRKKASRCLFRNVESAKCEPLELGGKKLQFVQSLKYLGTYTSVHIGRPKCLIL